MVLIFRWGGNDDVERRGGGQRGQHLDKCLPQKYHIELVVMYSEQKYAVNLLLVSNPDLGFTSSERRGSLLYLVFCLFSSNGSLDAIRGVVWLQITPT